MRKFYFLVHCVPILFFIFPILVRAQDCTLLGATFKTYESRCAATGSIKVFATGGSGSYKYKTLGPVNSNFTSADSLTGLSAGIYSVVVTDIIYNCTYTQTNLVVPGSYQDPRFALSKDDVTCDGGDNGSIQVMGQQYGRDPFIFSIVAPSAMGVGTINSTGIFNNLSAGDYTIRLTDSCGGIQTRQITLNDYTWWIDSYKFDKISCDTGSGYIKVIDSKGNISTAGGIAGFLYGIVRQPGDTVWSANANFQFGLAGHSSFEIVVKDDCGKIRKAPLSLTIIPDVNAIVISSKSCSTFTATVNGITNFFNPDFCLYDSSGRLVSCNATGIFNNLLYGNYCVKAHDFCTDTTIIRCFTSVPPLLSINNTALINNKTCTTFSATVTGQTGLTNPNYCLFDSAGALISCNTIGIFSNLSYSAYCIEVKDGCRDTTIKICFSPSRPVPSVPAIIFPNYFGSCTNFGISIGGDSLTSPQYCLFDSANVLIGCNNTGIFSGLAFGKYCTDVYDSCFDTTFVRCFTVGPPVVVNDILVPITNKTCTNFTVTAKSTNIQKALFCLYNSKDSLITCDSSGVFNNIQYGSYCIKAKNDCPDTTFIKCFTVVPDIPSVNTTVKIINTTCTTFSAQIYGQTNLTNPDYCLYDSADVKIICNSTGQFNNLWYAKYCVKIRDSCYDTTIVRCFIATPMPVNISVSANTSCSYNYAKFNITVSKGSLPVNIKIYSSNGNLFFTGNYNTNNISADSIIGTIAAQTYKIVATDDCGTKDSVSVGATASYLKHAAIVVAKCPSGTFTNGSGDIKATAQTNMGSLTVRIIKKDSITLSPQLAPNTVISGVNTFQDLGPGTYIVNYKANDACNIYLYDTVVIKPYKFPNLSRTSAYQCDVNGFTLEAEVSNGVGPFSYEIIGSSPAFPSIIAGPQAAPVFTINNGTNYSLVRLRALDACGNATLTDASILPLANNKIVNTFNCFQTATTLSLDTVYNSTFAWYKKINANSTDSTYFGAAASIFIPEVLPADTGIYICHVIVGGGCIIRSYSYHLDGSCYQLLPVTLQDFGGKFIDDKVLLNWKIAQYPNGKGFIIERKNSNNSFTEIGSVNADNNFAGILQYNFLDTRPEQQNFYRLKLIGDAQKYTYSNTIEIVKTPAVKNIQIYPNPVNNILNIRFTNQRSNTYKITLLTSLNQVIKEIRFTAGYNDLQIIRTKGMSRGMYVLKIINLNNNEVLTQKIIFR